MRARRTRRLRRGSPSCGLASVLQAASSAISIFGAVEASRTVLDGRRMDPMDPGNSGLPRRQRRGHYCNYLALCASLGRAIIVNRTSVIREHFVAKKINKVYVLYTLLLASWPLGRKKKCFVADDVVTDGGVACCNALFVKNKKKVRTREMNRTNLKKWSQ